MRPLYDRFQKLQLKPSDFEQLKIIGRGAFGQVALVKVGKSFNQILHLFVWIISSFLHSVGIDSHVQVGLI